MQGAEADRAAARESPAGTRPPAAAAAADAEASPPRYRVFAAIAIVLAALLVFARTSLHSSEAPGIDLAIVDLDDANWSHGVHRGNGRVILLTAADFPGDRIARGDFLQVQGSGFREVIAVEKNGIWLHVTLREPVRPPASGPLRARLLRAS